MAIEVKHKFVSSQPDSGNPDLIDPSDWNDDHDIVLAAQRIMGRAQATAGPVEEIPLGNGLQFSGGNLQVEFGTTGTTVAVGNHTHTASAISDFNTAADARVSAAIGVTVQAYNAALASWAGVSRAANFDAFVSSPTSANLRALLTDEVGTGAAYFVGGALGTPASATLTNATGLPLAGIVGSTTQALGVGSLEVGHATDTTLARSAAGVLTVEGVEIVTISRTQTLTNKRIPGRTFTITDVAGFSIDPTNGDIQKVTLGADRTPTFNNWQEGDHVTLLVDDGAARTLTLSAGSVVLDGGTPITLATTGWTELSILYENSKHRIKKIGEFAS